MTNAWAPLFLKLIEQVNDSFPEVEVDTWIPSPLAGIKRVVVYLRLSKVEKKKKRGRELSPAYQERICRQLASREKWQVVGVFSDIGVSGKSFDRPDWDKMMDAFESGSLKADAILCYDVSRYARSQSEGWRVLDEELPKYGLRIRTATNPYLAPETADGRMLFGVLLALAERERLDTIRRTNEALAELRQRGVQLGTFPKHFTKDEQGRIVPTAIAAEVVRRRAVGESYDAIGQSLGIPKKHAWEIARYVAVAAARRSIVESGDESDEALTFDRPTSV